MKTTYIFEAYYGAVTLTVDTELFTEEVRNEICSFFYPPHPKDEPFKFLALALHLLEIDYYELGVVRRAREGSLTQLEGWPKLDGSYGLYLEDIKSMELSIDEVDIRIKV